MNRIARIASLLLVGVLVLGLAAPAFATASQNEEEETPETTLTSEPQWDTPPAVVVPAAAVEEEELPWTARFIYPTIAAAAVLLVIGLAIGYNRSIRKKYEVVS